MSLWNLILAEIRFRRVNFVLSVLAVLTAAAAFVSGPTLLSGFARDTTDRLSAMEEQADEELAELDKQTIRIMRDLGVNLRIVHKDTNFGDLYTDYAARNFPEDFVERLATAESIENMVHLVATLEQKIKWNDRSVLVIGMLPKQTVAQQQEKKPHMVKAVKPGSVLVGHELGAGRKVGDALELNGHTFQIAAIQPEKGTREDVQLLLHLHDAQKVLGTPGEINQIMALSCKCHGNRLSVIRAELERVLPDTKVTEFGTQATAREMQRDLVAKARDSELARVRENRTRSQQALAALVGVTTPSLVFVAAVFVGVMTWLNVRERRPEIGVLRALGKGTTRIAALFLGKAAMLGLLGGLAGCAVGYFVVRLIGQQQLDIAATYLRPDARLLVAAVLGSPLIAALGSYLPTLAAVRQDPALILADP